MKSFFVGLLLSFVVLSCVRVSAKERGLSFVNALIQVESGGDYDAIGDDGKAYGVLQIRKEVITDVNSHYKNYYRKGIYIHNDAFCVDKSKEICWLYLKYWGGIYKKKFGKNPTKEVLARIWNGGPYGYKKKSTLKYWRKVKELLK